MRYVRKSKKGIIALLLVLVMTVSVIAYAAVADAAVTKSAAATGAENYYLWGLNTNDPDFGAMSAPTGSFSYDGTKGYYYYDLIGATGDYCFVVSKVNNSGASAVKIPAIGGAATAGQYYLSQGNYHGYSCLHLWNPAGESIRLYFTSENAGINAVPLSGGGDVPTTAPTSPPSAVGTVYCKNTAGWSDVYAYMWNGSGGAGKQNAEWPGVKMTLVSGNVFKYQYTAAYENIIFNIGSDSVKTTDMQFPGDGYMYDNSTGQWSVYGGTTPTTGPQPTTAPQPTTKPTTPPSTGGTIYCKNSAGWGEVYAYMWNGSGGAGNQNAEWPGIKMTDIGGGEWKHDYSTAYEHIIFNIGSDAAKTVDLQFPGNGYIYDNTSGQWSVYGGSTPQPTTGTQPTTKPTTPVNPTTAPGGNYVYCENELEWPVVSVYMWNGAGSVNNGAWPGPSATKVGGHLWRYALPKSYENIIFSDSGHDQTPDMKFPGAGYVYNNATKEWSLYDTSPLHVSSYATDLPSPQYAGVGIVMSAAAEGQGAVRYRFSATSSSGTTVVVQDYSVINSAVWTPKTAGKYTLTFEFWDTSGNTNKRTMNYTVEDGLSSAAPYIKQVTPVSGQQIKKSSACSVSVSAGGGLTGTNLLFYKFTLVDSTGKTVNTPYYSLKNSFSFTPAALGEYTLTVSVQGSDNAAAERSYVYNSVSTIVTPTEPAESSLKGDADSDGRVTVIDATRIQRYKAGIVPESMVNLKNADVDGDNKVTVLDATRIQRWLAGFEKTL